MGSEGVVGVSVKCSVKVDVKGVLWCVSRCWGLQGLISRSRCVSMVLVSVLSGHVKSVGMSQYLPQGDDVGLSEGVNILLGYVRKCLSERACI